jgi:hypothetical protein
MLKKALILGLVGALAAQCAPSALAHPPPPPGPHHWGPPGPGPCPGPSPRWYGWGPGGKAMFWTSFGLSCGALALGALVTYLPPERTVYVCNGTTYYSYGGSISKRPPAATW